MVSVTIIIIIIIIIISSNMYKNTCLAFDLE